MAGLVARYRELPVLLGRRKSLVGILTEPQQAAGARERPAVVILNAGIIHRVGPNRLHVQLARALAQAGVTVLRFDMSGIGDSPNRHDVLSPLEAAMADIREALDWLTATKQISRVVLMGLCAGADHSLLYSDSDPRVVGLMLLDPSIPKTRKFRLNSYSSRLSRLVRKSPAEAMESLANLWRRNVGAGAGLSEAEAGAQADLSDEELHRVLEPHFQACVRSGVRMLAVLTGGVPQQHNYGEQILDAFPEVAFGELLDIEFLGESDHAFTREADRAELSRLLLTWVETTAFTGGIGREQPSTPP